jgi:hypothetical protein
LIAASGVAIGLALTGCAPSGSGEAPPATTPTRPTGAAATITGPIEPGDAASFILGGAGPHLTAAGYRQSEFFASGTAHSYRAVGDESSDGKWVVQPASSARYRTRIVVRTPVDGARFNGTVLVEWLNVTGGSDLPADAIYLSPEMERAGYAWVGVSAQQAGVDSLRKSDPARYSSLSHPGDQFSYDIFTQVGRALRQGGSTSPLGSLHPKRLVAVGDSQSAIYLTTYIDAVQPIARVYSGFLVHSRSGGAIPLAGGSSQVGIFTGGIRIRTDVGVPVLLIITETDEALGHYFEARQPDTRFVRLWDVAGASHADTYAYGGAATTLGCSTVNEAPSHFVFEAALSAIDRWVRTGMPPPSAPRMDVQMVRGSPVVQRDRLGVVIGGIRGPWVAVPAAAYSGSAPPGFPVFCSLFGSTQAFSPQRLAALYGTRARYENLYAQATDRAIRVGYILPADRAAVLALAQRTRF